MTGLCLMFGNAFVLRSNGIITRTLLKHKRQMEKRQENRIGSISKGGSQYSGQGSLGLGFLEGLDTVGTLNGTLNGMKAVGTGKEEGGEDRRRVGKHPADGHLPFADERRS